jgi:putative PIN family toxin of toxin-antitoxin system
MTRVVLDTNIIVSALLVPSGTQAAVLLLALRGDVSLYVSLPVLAEYAEVLRRPSFKFQSRQVDTALADIRKVAHLIGPAKTLFISTHESDNRFLECAEAAEVDYLVTGNARHFPQTHKRTKIVTGRRFLDILAESERN